MIPQEITRRAGVAGGMFMSILPNLALEDVMRTFILGIIGTATSYFLSLFLQKMTSFINRKFERIFSKKKKEKKKAIQ